MMPNILQYPVTMIGILRAGLTLVNVNPLYTAHELEHQLTDAQVKALFIVENFAHTYTAIGRQLVDHVVVCSIGRSHGHCQRRVHQYHCALRQKSGTCLGN